MLRTLLVLDADGHLRDGSALWAAAGHDWSAPGDAPRRLAFSCVSPRPEAPDEASSWAPWSPAARAEFLGRCDEADDVFRAEGKMLCLVPRASDPLSDVPGVLTFVRQRSQSNVRIVLDPVLLLVESMLKTADDHLGRAILAIGPMPGVEALLLRNVSRAPDGALRPAPLSEPGGLLRPECFRELLLELARVEQSSVSRVPVGVMAEDLGLVRGWLGDVLGA